MSQINHLFGSTLEFSCTVIDGKIVSQELVSSTPDALISFKLDDEAFLSPADLRELADKIEGKDEYRRLATADECDAYMARGKEMFKAMESFKNNVNPSIGVCSVVVAEALANLSGITLYSENVVEAPATVPALSHVGSSRPEKYSEYIAQLKELMWEEEGEAYFYDEYEDEDEDEDEWDEDEELRF